MAGGLAAPIAGDALAARWSAVHAATLPLVGALATPEPPSAAAAVARLSPGTLDGAALALALSREAACRGEPAVELARHLDEMEAILDEMHSLAREARDTANSLPVGDAAARGGQGLSAADHAMIASSPLRCYEAELSLKHWIAEALVRRVPPPPDQVQALLAAWRCQPMLEPADAMRAGLEEHLKREQARGESAGDEEPPRRVDETSDDACEPT